MTGQTTAADVYYTIRLYDEITEDGYQGGFSTTSAPTLAEAIADGFRDATHRLAQYGRRAVMDGAQVCRPCDGRGTIDGKRGPKTCRACRGEGERELFSGAKLTPSEQVAIVNPYDAAETKEALADVMDRGADQADRMALAPNLFGTDWPKWAARYRAVAANYRAIPVLPPTR